MTSQQKFEHLLAELESFLNDEQFAISQDNWGYLDEILKKKEGHLKAMENLRADLDTRAYQARFQAISDKESACADALSAKMAEVKDARAHLDGVRSRMGKVREMTRLQGTPGSSFKAEA